MEAYPPGKGSRFSPEKQQKNLLPQLKIFGSVELSWKLIASFVETEWKTLCMLWILAKQQRKSSNSHLWQVQFKRWEMQTFLGT